MKSKVNRKKLHIAPRILLCESDELIRKVLVHHLEKYLHAEVYEADNGKVAEKVLSLRHFNLVITNQLLPIKSGLQVLETTRKELNNDVPFIVLGADGEDSSMIKAYRIGADDYLPNPINPTSLILKSQYLIKMVFKRNQN